MSSTGESGHHGMTFTIALPTADRVRAHRFYAALGLPTPGEAASDGVPEPLTVVVGEGAQLMLIPSGGFGWVTAGRETADRDVVECLLSLELSSATEVDDLVTRAEAAGAELVTPAQAQPWGYRATFADPDGHLWEVAWNPHWTVLDDGSVRLGG